jgi:hypothetical protein
MSPTRRRSAESPDARAIILDAANAAVSPVSVADLGTIPALGRKLSAMRLKTLLAEDVAAGRVFLWGTGKSKAYWVRDPLAVARDSRLGLASREALSTKELEQRVATELPAIAPKTVKAAYKHLKDEKRLCERSRVVVDLQRPQPFLELEIAKLLKPFGIEPGVERIRKLLGNEVSVPSKDSSGEEVAEKMFRALNRLAFSPGTTVTFYRLRQDPELAAISKDVFDRAALLLQQERRALLSVHDHAAALPAEEQQRLVTDGLGTFYVSIFTR